MKTYKLFNDIDISFLNPYPESVDLGVAIEEIENKVPPFLFQEVDVIYVGNLNFLSEEDVSSKYMDNAIYLTNMVTYESDIVCDIAFALGEFLEKKYMHLIIEKFYEYIIEDTEVVKDKYPALYYVLEEMIKNESC